MADIAKPEPLLPFDEEGRFAPPPPATDPHEPKEPRRAPTREEVRDLLRAFTCAVVEGESLYSNTPLPERRKQFDASREALLAAFDDMSRRIDAIAAERDEWKRRAEESDALNEGLNLALRLAQGDRDRHEAQARTESTRARKAEALAAKKLVDYADLDIRHDALLARADKAEAERDAALAALRAHGEIRLDIRHVSYLKLRVGVLLQLHWKDLTNEQLDAIHAVCLEALGEK